MELITPLMSSLINSLFTELLKHSEEEQAELRFIKKQLLETIYRTIEFVESLPNGTLTKAQNHESHTIVLAWSKIAVDLQDRNKILVNRAREFRDYVEKSIRASSPVRQDLIIRLKAFRSVLEAAPTRASPERAATKNPTLRKPATKKAAAIEPAPRPSPKKTTRKKTRKKKASTKETK